MRSIVRRVQFFWRPYHFLAVLSFGRKAMEDSMEYVSVSVALLALQGRLAASPIGHAAKLTAASLLPGLHSQLHSLKSPLYHHRRCCCSIEVLPSGWLSISHSSNGLSAHRSMDHHPDPALEEGNFVTMAQEPFIIISIDFGTT